MLERMLAREPLSRIIGRREFWGLEFLLSADTLDPRPESETIIEAVLARLPERDRHYRFLDLGTGTGCLLLALLSEYRGGARHRRRHRAGRRSDGARQCRAARPWGAGTVSSPAPGPRR